MRGGTNLKDDTERRRVNEIGGERYELSSSDGRDVTDNNNLRESIIAECN